MKNILGILGYPKLSIERSIFMIFVRLLEAYEPY